MRCTFIYHHSLRALHLKISTYSKPLEWLKPFSEQVKHNDFHRPRHRWCCTPSVADYQLSTQTTKQKEVERRHTADRRTVGVSTDVLFCPCPSSHCSTNQLIDIRGCKTTYDLDPMSKRVLIPLLLGNVLFLLISV